MKDKLKPGEMVRSLFRAPWRGEIVEGPDDINCYTIRVTIDRHDKPMRKPMLKRLHRHWLERVT